MDNVMFAYDAEKLIPKNVDVVSRQSGVGADYRRPYIATVIVENFDVNSVCVIAPDQSVIANDPMIVATYRRQIFKGKPSNLFQLHREDGLPAFVAPHLIEWFRNGETFNPSGASYFVDSRSVIRLLEKLGPEVGFTNEKGQWHRTDGPAIINSHFDFKDKYIENHKLLRTEEHKDIDYQSLLNSCMGSDLITIHY